MALLWLAAVSFLGLHFYAHRKNNNFQLGFNRQDFYILFGLFAIFIPVYLWNIYTIPFQIGPDEIFLNTFINDSLEEKLPNLFSTSNYRGNPTLVFIVIGKLALYALGEVNFLNLRIVHATCGLLIIIPAYIFYRLYGTRLFACGVTMLLMSQHALINLSRMVSRSNLPVLNILAAFLLLFIGLKRNCPWYSFIGGVVAGFSFYHFCIGRVTFFIWLAFVALIPIFFRNEISWRQVRKTTLISILGFLVTAGPIILHSTIKADPVHFQSRKAKLLIHPEGREHQKNVYRFSTIEEGIKLNIKNGLTIFNSKHYDRGNHYLNRRYGFVDPLTGIFIWIGLLSYLFRRKKEMKDVLILSSFLSLWFIFIFISGLTPVFMRLLIILPLVACLTAEGLRVGIYFIGKFVFHRFFHGSSAQLIKNILFLFGIIGIVGWNGYMWSDYIKSGLTENYLRGKTLRYVEDRKIHQNHMFYLIYDAFSDKHSKGAQKSFNKRAENPERVSAVPLDHILNETYDHPFTIFIHQNLWIKIKGAFLQKYSQPKIHFLNSQGDFLAIEVL